ncbi:MAG: hypothetical protein WAM97_21475 [Acidimicrobiales bacterium]
MADATLKLTRKTGGIIDMNRAWEVEIDGKVVGSVDYRTTVEIPISPGTHTLRVFLGRHLSRPRTFEAPDGGVVSFHCRAQLFWPMFIASVIKPDLWIILRQDK